MSRIRAGIESGFGNWDDTVSSCVVVQKMESPMLWIAVPCSLRSKSRISTLATASKRTVAPITKISRSLRWRCVGVRAWRTSRISRSPNRRMSPATPGSIPGVAVVRRARLARDERVVVGGDAVLGAFGNQHDRAERLVVAGQRSARHVQLPAHVGKDAAVDERPRLKHA